MVSGATKWRRNRGREWLAQIPAFLRIRISKLQVQRLLYLNIAVYKYLSKCVHRSYVVGIIWKDKNNGEKEKKKLLIWFTTFRSFPILPSHTMRYPSWIHDFSVGCTLLGCPNRIRGSTYPSLWWNRSTYRPERLFWCRVTHWGLVTAGHFSCPLDEVKQTGPQHIP